MPEKKRWRLAISRSMSRRSFLVYFPSSHFHAVDALADLEEVRERASDPASCDEWHADRLSSLLNSRLSLIFPANEEYHSVMSGNGLNIFLCASEVPFGLFKVEYLDFVLGAEYEGLDGRVSARLSIAKMRSGLEHSVDYNGIYGGFFF
jgi:hypothetical protein